MPFLPPNQQHQSTEGTSTEGTKCRRKQQENEKEDNYFFSHHSVHAMYSGTFISNIIFILVAALLRVVGLTAGLAESNGRLPPGL